MSDTRLVDDDSIVDESVTEPGDGDKSGDEHGNVHSINLCVLVDEL